MTAFLPIHTFACCCLPIGEMAYKLVSSTGYMPFCSIYAPGFPETLVRFVLCIVV